MSAVVDWEAFLIYILEVTGFNLEMNRRYSEDFPCLPLFLHSDPE